MAKLPGAYKARRPRRPRASGGTCRACGALRDRDEAGAARMLGRPGLCRACLGRLGVPVARPVVGEAD